MTHQLAHTALDATLAFSEQRDYRGYNKHDGLNSPILKSVFGWAKWPRLLATQAVTRSPWNIRPLLRVPMTRNPKGIGLFANALLDRYAYAGDAADSKKACELLDWLLAHPAAGFRGLSWGYPYPWQDIGFFAPPDYPNRVVTCWIGFSFLEAARLTGHARYRECLDPIAEFLTQEPNILYDSDVMKCYSYVPDVTVDWAVMDVPALVGAYLAEASVILGNEGYRHEAEKLIRWVVDKQTDYGAWFYTDPPTDSHITHDNYHTGIIVDCLDRYREATGDNQFDTAYWSGVAYYRDHLFTSAGAPRWMNTREFPYDVHGAAAGILSFTRAARRDRSFESAAWKTADWALENLYHPSGYFYYQMGRLRTKRFCLIRWCNGWMTRALATLLRFSSDNPLPST